MATERLEAELVSHAAWEAVGLARMLDVLGEFDRRDGWSRWIGCLSIQHWLSWQCGLGYTAATERLRVARILPSLPTIRRLLHDGALSWSKVRELTRVATPDDEAMWADLATMLTAAQLSRLARTRRRITAADVLSQHERRELTSRIDDDGSTVIVLRLPADEATPVLAAIDTTAGPPQRDIPTGRRRADAAIDLLLGRVEVRTDVQIHLDHCPTCQATTAVTADGTPLHPAIADTLACDADLVTTHHTHDHDPCDPHDQDCGGATAEVATAAEVNRVEVGEIDRHRGPNRQQRRWLAHHHPTCQFPGCHHTGRFDAHHLIAHPDGGPTHITNLVRLCRAHHRLVHLARLVLELDTNRQLTITTPNGHPINTTITRRALHHALRLPAPDDPTRITALGEHMDIDTCLTAIHHHTRPTTHAA